MEDKQINFPSFISKEKQEKILDAIKQEKIIIITGCQKPMGKTTVVNILKNNGILAFEKFECVEIEI